MTFSLHGDGAQGTREWVDGQNVGFSKSFGKAEHAPQGPVALTANPNSDGTFTLTVEAEGHKAFVKDIPPADLPDEFARVATAVLGAIQKGEFARSREVPVHLGLNRPRPNWENLRFMSK